MKRVFWGLVIVAIVLVAAPGYIGYKVEGHYQALVEQFEKSGFRRMDSRFDRGWFNSSAQSQFSLQLPSEVGSAALAEPLVFTLQSDVIHGPWIKTPFSGLAEIESLILVGGENIFPADYPAKIHTLVSLDGSGKTQVDLPETEIEPTGDRPAIQFGGLQGALQFDADFQDVNLDFNIPSINIGGQNNPVASINQVQINSHSWKNSSGLVLGDGRFTIGSVSAKPELGNGLTIEKINIEVDSEERDDKVSANASYRFQDLRVGGDRFGPAEMQLAFEQLPSAVLLSIQQVMEEISRKQMQPAQQQMAMMSLLFSNGPALLASDPRFSLNKLHVVTPEGVVEGDFTLQSVGLEWKDISNPKVIMEKLLANAHINIPQVYLKKLLTLQMQRQILQQYQARQQAGEEVELPNQTSLEELSAGMAEGQLESLLAQGLLRKESDAYTAQMNMEAGLLTVNGKSIPLQINR